METLIYFAFWAGLFFLMMRFGCGAHIMGSNHSRGTTPAGSGTTNNPEVRWVPPEKDTDPVCNKTVKTDAAKSSIHAGTVYYLCSRECREIFEAAPDLYVTDIDSGQELERSHA